jgi:hypothetical protein
MKKFHDVEGTEYSVNTCVDLRGVLIELRGSALKANNFEWAVALSHTIAMWHFMALEIFGDEYQKGMDAWLTNSKASISSYTITLGSPTLEDASDSTSSDT